MVLMLNVLMMVAMIIVMMMLFVVMLQMVLVVIAMMIIRILMMVIVIKKKEFAACYTCFSLIETFKLKCLLFCICNGAEWSKDRTQAAESIKWRPQQAYGSNQALFAQPQAVFSTHKILTRTHR